MPENPFPSRGGAVSTCLGWLLPLLAAALLTPAARADSDDIAYGKPVTTNGATDPGHPASLVTDGDSATFSNPQSLPATGFYYQVDLGKEYALQTLEIDSRIDGATDRLSQVELTVLADAGGSPGDVRWRYQIRPDGSQNVAGGTDVLTADLNPTGTFRGRYLRLTNLSNASYAPQVAEIEAYEAPGPQIDYFGPDSGNLAAAGASTTLRWNVEGATAIQIDHGVGAVSGPSGSVTITPGTATTYTLIATNKAGFITTTATVGVNDAEIPAQISEFLASNVGGIKDRDGNHPDWIEIYNPNSFTLNLKDYYLTDSASKKTKWKFPLFAIPPFGYSIVFADSSTTSPDLDTPHTSFSLSADGEYVGLVAKDGSTVLSQIPAAGGTYPAQSADHSYGGANGVTGFFSPPTPNAPNGTAYAGIVQDVTFSQGRGFYSSAIQVALTSATAGTQIRYTADGSVPTATTGTLYSGPLTLNATTVLRAIAFRSGWAPSTPNTQTYLFPASILSSTPWRGGLADATTMTAALKQVPSMSLTVGNQTINGGVDTVGTLEWIDPNGGAGFQVPCGTKLFGGAFTNFDKKSFRVSFKGDYGASKLDFPLFTGFERGLTPATSFDQIELRSGSHDMSERGFYMSNPFTDASLLDMGSFGPHGRFVHLYLNGVYWGLYHMRERWGASNTSSYYGDPKESYESINGNLNVGGWDPGEVYDGTGDTWATAKALALQGDCYRQLRPYVDMPQYIDYMTLFMFGDSEDEYRTSGPAGEGSGFKFMLNDADGFLRTSAGDRTARGAPGNLNGDGPGSFFSMLYAGADPDYRLLLADRIQRSYVSPGGALTPDRNAARLNDLCAGINQAIAAECARWNYQTVSSWTSQKNNILTAWFPGHTSTVLGYYQAAGFFPSMAAPVFSLPPGIVASGAPLAMTTAPGSVTYYTLDGSDPRQSPSALPDVPLVTSSTPGRFHVPASASDGFSPVNVPGLLGYWSFDGHTLDSVGGFHGVAKGEPTYVAGHQGQAISLNGTNQYVSLGDPPGLKILGQITVSAWIQAQPDGSIQNIVNKGHDASSSPNGEITLRMVGGAYQAGYWAGSLGTAIAQGPSSGPGSATADAGQWVHLAMTWDGAFWRLYRNGVQIGSTASSVGAVTVPAVGWAIGARGTGTERFFKGQIDDVRIYGRSLTPQEIGLVYNGTASTDTGLWAQAAQDDSSWTASAGHWGFAPAGSALLPQINHDVSAAMTGRPNALLRLPFTLGSNQAFRSLQAKVRADDGYALYLNGVRVAARNAPAPSDGSSIATAETPDTTAAAGETVDLTPAIPLLKTGTNVLAIQGLNHGASDADFLIGAELSGGLQGGGQSPGALAYTTPLPLNASALVNARNYSPATGDWSALQQSFYQVGPSPCPPGAVVVSEVHYHPLIDGGEFIELLNVSNAAVNLRGASFTQGISYKFPDNRDVPLAPGERLVLAENQLIFQQIHGWQEPVAGMYASSLANEGERLVLTAADGATTLIDFTYSPLAPWPTGADGSGPSLVLIRPTPGIDLNLASNWRLSTQPDGNPNTTDAPAFTGDPNADADHDGLTAYMEYALGSSDTIPEPQPLTISSDLSSGFATATVTHAVSGESANLRVEASNDLVTWNVPVTLNARQFLANGRLLSTWRATATEGLPLFLRLRAGEP
jgi:hypothetical protein